MTNTHANPVHPLQAWILAARPKTLPAAATPVIVASALAFRAGAFRLGPALAALIAALLLQIGANIANDYFDFYKGADTAERLGPVRVTQAGLLKPQQVYRGMWFVFFLAGLLGIYLAIVGGWPVIVIGLCAILAALAYTGGPFPLGYHGLGEVFVLIFFGPAAVCGAYYIQDHSLTPLVWWSSIPVGLLIVAILVVNNIRDIETDRAAGKMTLAVLLGRRGAQIEYFLMLVGAYLAPFLLWITGLVPPWALLSWLSVWFAYRQYRSLLILKGRPLNQTLAGTGQLVLLFGVLFSLGLVIEKIFS